MAFTLPQSCCKEYSVVDILTRPGMANLHLNVEHTRWCVYQAYILLVRQSHSTSCITHVFTWQVNTCIIQLVECDWRTNKICAWTFTCLVPHLRQQFTKLPCGHFAPVLRVELDICCCKSVSSSFRNLYLVVGDTGCIRFVCRYVYYGSK
jgi:hypothetical protein